MHVMLTLFVTLSALFVQTGQALVPERPSSSSYSRRNRSWEDHFQQLSNFFLQHGHSQVPHLYPPNPSLATWVRNQKSAYRRLLYSDSSSPQNQPRKRNKDNTNTQLSETGLTPTRIAALHSLDLFSSYTRIPSLSDTLQDYDDVSDLLIRNHNRELYWKQMLDRLIVFKDTYGHVNVPLRYSDDPSLGQWVINQRILWKKYMVGRSKILSPNQQELMQAKMTALNSLGFCYDVPTFQWYTMFQRLVQYKEQRRKGYMNETTALIRNQILQEYQREEKKRLKNTRYIQKLLLGYQQQLLLLRYQQKIKGYSGNYEEDQQIQREDQKMSQTIQTLQQQMETLKKNLVLPHVSDEEIQTHVQDNLDYYFYVPLNDLSNQDLRLWIHAQRRDFARRSKNATQDILVVDPTTVERQGALESIGFTWTSSPSRRKIQLGNIDIEWIQRQEESKDGLDTGDIFPQIRIKNNVEKTEFTLDRKEGRKRNKSEPNGIQGDRKSKKEYSSDGKIEYTNAIDNSSLREQFTPKKLLPQRWNDGEWIEDDLLELWDEEDDD